MWEDGPVDRCSSPRQHGRRPPGRDDAGTVAPDGRPFAKTLTTRRIDAGVVARSPWGTSRVFTFRSSGLLMSHRQRFGDSLEHDTHDTWFAEGALNGSSGKHAWVTGTAVQQDGYRNKDLPSFDYRYTSTALFAQDDYAPVPWLSASVSGRLDIHSDFGTFSARVCRCSPSPSPDGARGRPVGTVFYVPLLFLEETEATGLSRLAPLGDLDPERGRSVSLDLGWKHQWLELTGTIFRSRIDELAAAARQRRGGCASRADHQCAGLRQHGRDGTDRASASRRVRPDCHAHVSALHRT